MDHEENYFQSTEVVWYRHRRRVLTCLDWATLEAWFEAKIPLDSVIAGIERTFENLKKSKRKIRPESLSYCAPEIYRNAEETSVERHWKNSEKNT